MLYAVIPLSEGGEQVRSHVQRLDPGAYVAYGPTVYFLRFNGTASSLAEQVGFDTGPATGIVVSIRDYFGFASKELWSWMGNK